MLENLQKTSFHEYISIDAVSRSDLLNICRSVKYFKHCKDAPKKETEAMVFGRMAHKFILENASFFDEYHLLDFEVNKRTKEGKAALEFALAEAKGKELVEISDYERLVGMRDALLSNQLVASKNLLSEELTEQTLVWDAQVSYDSVAIKCKCRPDKIYISDRAIAIIDLKTCSSLDSFPHEIFSRKYHMQVAFYIDGFYFATGKLCNKFLLIAVEKEPPFLNKIYQIDDKAIELGRAEYRSLLEKYYKHIILGDQEEDVAETVQVPFWYKLKVKF